MTISEKIFTTHDTHNIFISLIHKEKTKSPNVLKCAKEMNRRFTEKHVCMVLNYRERPLALFIIRTMPRERSSLLYKIGQKF